MDREKRVRMEAGDWLRPPLMGTDTGGDEDEEEEQDEHAVDSFIFLLTPHPPL